MSATISELRAFVSAVDLGSVGRAATVLGVTQSALSKRLKSLESLAGVALLERSAAGVVPTEAGRVLLADARRIVAQMDALDDRLGRLGGISEPVRVAASPAIAERVVPAAIALLDVGDRSLPVELLVANSSVVRASVADGRSDVGVAAAGADEDLAPLGRPLLDDELVVVLEPDDRWAAYDAIPVAELGHRRMIVRDPGSHARHLLEEGIAAAGVHLAPPLLEVGNPAAVKAAIHARHEPGVLSCHAVDPTAERLVTRSVEGADLRRRFWVLLAPGAGPGATRVAERLLEQAGTAP